jgi:hypothetical protein
VAPARNAPWQLSTDWRLRRTRRAMNPATRPPRSGCGAMDWDDVRVFLAVAREGSMRAAGRALGLSQPTIARRLAAFEASRGYWLSTPSAPMGYLSEPSPGSIETADWQRISKPQSPARCTAVRSPLSLSLGDRGFESRPLQRRVLCESNADEGERDRARLASGLENAVGVRRSSMYSALSRLQRLPWQTPRRS